MKASGSIGVALLVTGIVLLMIAWQKPDYIDAAGMLIEPFAYRVAGVGLTALGTVLLAVRYLVYRRS
ncbi:DUF3955 domain-containing protein [uncultured Thiodictyon sp.]|jgi:hypothetical protein|uniref:DUF3955 domain-containing protein n=1 Tax=uncultured Thiodictyon sp. TaxID=1846217 RepID=UPI0025CE7C15|nr:DUF3955 domain-containing protein [uncultured Thiodictyon sp.]